MGGFKAVDKEGILGGVPPARVEETARGRGSWVDILARYLTILHNRYFSTLRSLEWSLDRSLDSPSNGISTQYQPHL